MQSPLGYTRFELWLQMRCPTKVAGSWANVQGLDLDWACDVSHRTYYYVTHAMSHLAMQWLQKFAQSLHERFTCDGCPIWLLKGIHWGSNTGCACNCVIQKPIPRGFFGIPQGFLYVFVFFTGNEQLCIIFHIFYSSFPSFFPVCMNKLRHRETQWSVHTAHGCTKVAHVYTGLHRITQD